MRLDPAELPELPLPAALLDQRRQVVVATPEWRGSTPGCVTYYAGHGHLAVGPSQPPDPDLQVVLEELLAELDRTAARLERADAGRVRVLTGGLRLVAGEPLSDADRGSSTETLELASLAIEARVNPPLRVLVADHDPPLDVPAPAVVALALVQFAVNVAQHERVDAAGARRVESVCVRAAPGPSFHLEWESEAPTSVGVRTGRHVQRRARWGLGYVRMAADALGGTALPPAPAGPDRESVGFGLGARNLTLPLACLEHGSLARTTRAWDQEHEAASGVPDGALEALVQEAREAGGAIVHRDFHAARAVPGTDRVWVVMPPELGEDRVRDVLRGLDHERLLLTAPEPHATTLHALNAVLRRGLGEQLVTCSAAEWQRRFPAACAALGVAPPSVTGCLSYPDPYLAAWLLAQVGGRLDVDGDGSTGFRPARVDDPRVRLLRPGDDGVVRLAAGLPV